MLKNTSNVIFVACTGPSFNGRVHNQAGRLSLLCCVEDEKVLFAWKVEKQTEQHLRSTRFLVSLVNKVDLDDIQNTVTKPHQKEALRHPPLCPFGEGLTSHQINCGTSLEEKKMCVILKHKRQWTTEEIPQ